MGDSFTIGEAQDTFTVGIGADGFTVAPEVNLFEVGADVTTITVNYGAVTVGAADTRTTIHAPSDNTTITDVNPNVTADVICDIPEGNVGDRATIRLTHPYEGDDTWIGKSLTVRGETHEVYGPSVFYVQGPPTRGAFGDMTPIFGAAPFDFSGANELTMTWDVSGTEYTVTLDTDFAGNAFAFASAIVAQLPGVELTTEYQVFDGPLLDYAFMTTATGDGASITVVDSGTGDPLGLDGITSYPGSDGDRVGWNGSPEGAGTTTTHAWPDYQPVNDPSPHSAVTFKLVGTPIGMMADQNYQRNEYTDFATPAIGGPLDDEKNNYGAFSTINQELKDLIAGGGGGGSGDVVGPASSTDGHAVEMDGSTGKLIKQANLTGAYGRPKLDADGTWADVLMPSSIARDSEVTAAISSHAGAADPHGDRAYAASLFAANDALVFKGVIDCSANPDYPAADAGHTYRVSVAGRIGGLSGPRVEAGELLACTVDSSATGNHATVGANWTIGQVNLDGAVTGPTSATDGNLVLMDGTSGRLVKDGGSVSAAIAAAGIVSSPWVSLADTTLGADAMSVSLSWSGDYEFLELHWIAFADGAFASLNASLQFNSDTAANYINATSSSSAFTLAAIAGSLTNTNRRGHGKLRVSNSLAYHNLDSEYGYQNSNAATTVFGTLRGAWQSTARINSIQLSLGGIKFVAGSRFTVLGRA